jgi:hypothetical protein
MTYHYSSVFPKVLLALTVFSIGCLTAFYMVEVQRITQGHYQIEIYQGEINQLAKLTQKLDNDYQHLNTLESLTPKIEALGMVPAGELAYLDLSTQRMAAK